MEIKPILLSLKRNKFMAILLVIQIAFTMGVLSSSIFVAMTTLAEWNLPSGIPQNDVIRISPRFYDDNKDVKQAVLNDLERVKKIPGVIDIAPSNAVPFTAENMISIYKSSEEEAQKYNSVVFESNTALFNVLGLKLIDGEMLTENDVIYPDANGDFQPSARVMISQQMAEAMFPDSTAVGQTIWLSKGADPVKVVGVYSNFMTGERLNGRGQSYHSVFRPNYNWAQGKEPHYLIRAETDAAEGMVEDVLSIFYKEQGRYIATSELLKRTQKRMYDGRGSRALTFLVISAVLLLITAFGVTGLTSFQVNQRRKQIGTRRALGARKSDILKYFILENSIITLVGLFFGIILTFTLTFELGNESAQNFLNIGALIGTAAGLWLINTLATWFPAKQASNIEPAIVTRSA